MHLAMVRNCHCVSVEGFRSWEPYSCSEEQAGRLSVFIRLVSGGVSKRAERIGSAIRILLPLLVLAGSWNTPNESDAGGSDACSCGLDSGRRAE